MTAPITDADIARLLREGNQAFGPDALSLLLRLVAEHAERGRRAPGWRESLTTNTAAAGE